MTHAAFTKNVAKLSDLMAARGGELELREEKESGVVMVQGPQSYGG